MVDVWLISIISIINRMYECMNVWMYECMKYESINLRIYECMTVWMNAFLLM
jgi:hypothetical protein